MKKESSQFKKGFTLVETLVATIILAISITALMNVVARGVFNSGYVKNKAIAISLAQEGVELVRNIQDSSLLAGVGAGSQTSEVFTGTLFSSCYGIDCYIDATQSPLNPQTCTGGNDIDDIDSLCPVLRISPDGYFNYTTGDSNNPLDARFVRTISVIQNTNSDIPSARVEVKVEWLQGGAVRSVVYETDIFLWIQ